MHTVIPTHWWGAGEGRKEKKRGRARGKKHEPAGSRLAGVLTGTSSSE